MKELSINNCLIEREKVFKNKEGAGGCYFGVENRRRVNTHKPSPYPEVVVILERLLIQSEDNSTLNVGRTPTDRVYKTRSDSLLTPVIKV